MSHWTGTAAPVGATVMAKMLVLLAAPEENLRSFAAARIGIPRGQFAREKESENRNLTRVTRTERAGDWVTARGEETDTESFKT